MSVPSTALHPSSPAVAAPPDVDAGDPDVAVRQGDTEESLKESSDQALIARFVDRQDPEALGVLYDRHAPARHPQANVHL